MATARKLPSGNYRVRIYSHTDSSGKKIYESFTASTKAEAEMIASKFANKTDRKRANDLTVKEAVQNYMDKNNNVLSPSTLYGYQVCFNRLEPIYSIKIRKINSSDIQAFISQLIDAGYSPKTIKSTYGLLLSSLSFSGVETNYKVHLPSTKKQAPKSPENEQIEALYKEASPTLKKAIMLGCLSLRRGEISALKFGDIQGNTLFIHADMVWGADKEWHYKDMPKTNASYRTVYLPDFLLEMLGTGSPDQYILDVKPNAIGNAFLRLKKKLDIDIRFHDLRHYFASLAKVLNIPDNYTATLGGWENGSPVLKQVYQNNVVSMNEIYAKRINEHLKSMTQNMTR